MSVQFRWIQWCCSQCQCCAADDSVTNLIKIRSIEHKYCGCRESSKQRAKMKTSDGDRSPDVEEVKEALEYEFAEDSAPKETSVESPEIPLSHPLTSALAPYCAVTLQGEVEGKALSSRFAINLVAGHDDESDIVFHFNPRFDQRYTARNSLLLGKWGLEECSSRQKFPFQVGEPFFIEIFLTHKEFLVAVNGSHYCSYTYRTSILRICNIQVEGNVKLTRLRIVPQVSIYPSPTPPDFPSSPYIFPLESQGTTKNVSEITPVYGCFQDELKPGSEIIISGKVGLLPHVFYFNLQDGSQIWPHPIIAFHVSVRFINGEDSVRVNSWSDGEWGKEEQARKCLFNPGYNFKVKITCKEGAFNVEVDDEHQLAFKYRVPLKKINTIYIQGDLRIYEITVHL